MRGNERKLGVELSVAVRNGSLRGDLSSCCVSGEVEFVIISFVFSPYFESGRC